MIVLPVLPRGTVVSPQLVRTSGDLVSSLGGPTQRITRLGSRYTAAVELPSLDPNCAALWLSAPLRAEASGDTLALIMPQMLKVSQIANVAGTGAAGSYQVIYTGPDPGVGMWFSYLAGGRHFLHLITAVAPATKTLNVSPLLRQAMAASPMQFQQPLLEGFVDAPTWSLEFFRFVGFKFSITESA